MAPALKAWATGRLLDGVDPEYAKRAASVRRVRLARPLVLVDAQPLAERRERALRAALAVADLAAGADGRGGVRVGQRESLRVDQARRVAHVAAEPDREAALGRAVAAGGAHDGARDPQVGAAVGHARE